MNTSGSRDHGYLAGQTTYADENGAEFGNVSASGDYIGDAAHESQEDTSGVELEYEQPVEHEEQVRCVVIIIIIFLLQLFLLLLLLFLLFLPLFFIPPTLSFHSPSSSSVAAAALYP